MAPDLSNYKFMLVIQVSKLSNMGPVQLNTRSWNVSTVRCQSIQNKKLQQQVKLAGHKLFISEGVSSGQLRGAAYLRGLSFSKFSSASPDEIKKSFIKAKAEDEWQTLQRKVAGTDEIWKDVRVICLIGSIQDEEDSSDEIIQSLNRQMDKSTKIITAENSTQTPHIVVGTLDINIGVKLPSEDLIAQFPKGQDKAKRAYISNVCVAPVVRRMGVAQALIEEAKLRCKKDGVQYLYVHVEENNVGAKKLYSEVCGFEIEDIESIQMAKLMRRDRRFLLRLQL
eukprot:TRINITY_DN18355_c0_g1_i1.p1 TRINITY_DN18355_c0_g1~~TRINITY_DN18355_c0_g1_i1.p1  ORF type:complete len:282 (-),score=39.25 TRINITY_DN18355_c0_g1_i1:274-1119(-)